MIFISIQLQFLSSLLVRGLNSFHGDLNCACLCQTSKLLYFISLSSVRSFPSTLYLLGTINIWYHLLSSFKVMYLTRFLYLSALILVGLNFLVILNHFPFHWSLILFIFSYLKLFSWLYLKIDNFYSPKVFYDNQIKVIKCLYIKGQR